MVTMLRRSRTLKATSNSHTTTRASHEVNKAFLCQHFKINYSIQHATDENEHKVPSF
jgi:hypothetical protein